jgi:hypothetical protein
MMASGSRFTVERELTDASEIKQTQSGTPTSYRDEWIDTQVVLNHAVYKIEKHDPAVTHLKILSTFRKPVIIHRLLDTLKQSVTVISLAIIGIQMNEEHATQLAAALSEPGTALQCLQLCRVLPAGVAPLCQALASSRTLKELRLTFQHDLSLDEIEMLTTALAKNTSIQIFKLYCVDFCSRGMELLAETIRNNTTLRDVRLTSCNLTNVSSLVAAIQESNRIRSLDLSLNHISDAVSLAVLLNTPSITYLSLSQNDLGGSSCNDDCDNTEIYKTLRSNTSLKRLYLDMNPLGTDFAEKISAALQHNTTLIRLGLLTRTLPANVMNKIGHAVQLNEKGRGFLRREESALLALLFPRLLDRVSMEPHLLYGLLKERPDLWIQQL